MTLMLLECRGCNDMFLFAASSKEQEESHHPRSVGLGA